MKVEATKPTSLEVSNHFFHDAVDFEIRYSFCMDSEGPRFDTPRSRRMKCFIDLRMGFESVLKSITCYYESGDRKGKTLVNWVEKFGHNIGKMMRKCGSHLPSEFMAEYEDHITSLDNLPVGLRYRLDGWDFRNNKHATYASTIGSDEYLDKMSKALKELIAFQNSNLQAHSRVVSLSEGLEELMERRHQKYT